MAAVKSSILPSMRTDRSRTAVRSGLAGDLSGSLFTIHNVPTNVAMELIQKKTFFHCRGPGIRMLVKSVPSGSSALF